MNERSYLSIGDVLALLRDEFPDITISKIRFLESRGLLVPERTPSGYRKFYDRDVDRLRWILRQQREHFLPLKVIKGRLEGAEGTDPPALFEVNPGDPVPAADEADEDVGGEREPAMAGRLVGRGAGAAERSVAAHAAPPAAPAPTAAAAVGGHSAGTNGSPLQAAARTGREDAVSAPGGPPRGSAPGAAARTPGATGSAPGAAVASSSQHPAAGGSQRAGAGQAGERAAGGSPAPVDGPPLTGASLTLAELAHASGLDVKQVEELESYGLIDGRTVAGVHCFDEDALVIAGLAAGFAAFGIEARHLRLFKHAAERQAGLYSQVVLPLLRQRNPEARRRALDELARLSELGASLQGSFARLLLRDLTGG